MESWKNSMILHQDIGGFVHRIKNLKRTFSELYYCTILVCITRLKIELYYTFRMIISRSLYHGLSQLPHRFCNNFFRIGPKKTRPDQKKRIDTEAAWEVKYAVFLLNLIFTLVFCINKCYDFMKKMKNWFIDLHSSSPKTVLFTPFQLDQLGLWLFHRKTKLKNWVCFTLGPPVRS